MKIFPKFESAFKNVVYPRESDWRRRLRACDPEKFPVYFRLALPMGDISREELERLAAVSDDAEHFAHALLDLVGQKRPDGRTRVCQALEQLSDSKAAIFHQDAVPSAIAALLDVGDQLIKVKDSTGWFGIISNKDRMVHLVMLLLRRLDEPQRLDVLKASTERGQALSAIVEIVAALGDQHGKYSGEGSPPQDRLLDTSELSVMEQVASQRIFDAAETGGILCTPELAHVLYRRKDWGDAESLADRLQGLLSDESNFLMFLRNFWPDDTVKATKDSTSSVKVWQNPPEIREFVKIDNFAHQIELLSQRDDLTEEDRIRLELLTSDKAQRHKG